MRPITGSSLIVAGLLSAVLFPAAAQMLLRGREGGQPELRGRGAVAP